ncbi:N-acetylmuramoyl-L-alanine amidase [Candidatus Saccharibacteria bacterium]|nr:N-acetylmuramoyl-L-alanine amidase [Candidatus Saccharibacteria bacterium]
MVKRFLTLATVALSAVMIYGVANAFVIPENLLKEYSANDIYFIDPCASGANSNRGNGCVGTLPGSNNAELTWNAIVEANVDGVSNNPAAIAGIMGNLMQETGFDPFEQKGKYYGIHMTPDQEFIDVINNAGLGQYWGRGNEAPKEAVKQAIELEINWIMKTNERFLGVGTWEGRGFMSFVNDVSENTPEAYSDLFLTAVEDADWPSSQSQWKGNNIIEEPAAKEVGRRVRGEEMYYQEAEVRRDYAREFYEKYGSSGVCNLGGAFNGTEVTWQDLAPLGTNDRLKLLVERYGEYAMQLQKYYGIPWELPFAVMVFESEVGTNTNSVSYLVQQAGYYNMMGLTYPVPGEHEEYVVDRYRVTNAGDNGCFRNEKYKQCHVAYESISKMLLGYTIYHGRSGYEGDASYDGGLKLLSPSNYNLNDAIKKLMHSYCGTTTSSTYCGDGTGITDVIRGGTSRLAKDYSGLMDVVKEKGWMNSEELAKAWNIQPGGIATQQWGWGDIREQIWNAYGEAGLPGNASATTGATSITGGTASTGTMSGSLVGNAVLHKPQNEWLENAGLEGYIKDPVTPGGANGIRVDSSASDGSNYTEFASDAGAGSGLPGFIVLHLTEADNFDKRSWQNFKGDGVYVPPHFTIDVKKREVFQHFPLSHPSAAVKRRNGMVPDKYGIQIEIVGHGGDDRGDNLETCIHGACSDEYNFRNFTEEDYEYLAKLLIAISNETGIPLTSSVQWAKTAEEAPSLIIKDDEELKKYIGVLGHTHVNGKWDPLNLWEYLEPVLAKMGYSYNTSAYSNSVNCGNSGLGATLLRGHCFDIPSGDGGCTEDGFTWFGQGGDSWSTKQYGKKCGGSTMRSSGCGPSAMAMVVTALTGQLVKPDEMAEKADEVGARICGSGTDVVTMTTKIAPMYGLQAQCVPSSQVTVDNVNKWFDEGKMAVFSVGNEYSTEFGPMGSANGHVVALRGRASDGKWYTFDSSRRDVPKNDRHYKPEEVVKAFQAHGRDNFCLVYK